MFRGVTIPRQPEVPLHTSRKIAVVNAGIEFEAGGAPHRSSCAEHVRDGLGARDDAHGELVS